MNSLHTPKLTNGVIFLRPLTAEDAADHLAGEDEEMAKWVSGGRSTPATVEAFIRNSQENWRSGGPRRAFGVFDCVTNRLVGFIEVNLTLLDEPGQVSVSYGVFRQWRRQGLALRAIDLMDEYLRTATEARQIVLRIAPANTVSLKLAEKAGFTLRGLFDESEGPMVRYVRDINYLKGSFAYLDKAIEAIGQKNTPVKSSPISPLKSAEATRLALVVESLAHAFDHYGQMVEYLRMNGVVPPASRP